MTLTAQPLVTSVVSLKVEVGDLEQAAKIELRLLHTLYNICYHGGHKPVNELLSLNLTNLFNSFDSS